MNPYDVFKTPSNNNASETTITLARMLDDLLRVEDETKERMHKAALSGNTTDVARYGGEISGIALARSVVNRSYHESVSRDRMKRELDHIVAEANRGVGARGVPSRRANGGL